MPTRLIVRFAGLGYFQFILTRSYSHPSRWLFRCVVFGGTPFGVPSISGTSIRWQERAVAPHAVAPVFRFCFEDFGRLNVWPLREKMRQKNAYGRDGCAPGKQAYRISYFHPGETLPSDFIKVECISRTQRQ